MKPFIIAALAISLGLTSCNDLLDLEPKSQISQVDYFKTETDLQLFSNSFYNNLLDKSPYDDQSDIYIQQNLSDEMLGGQQAHRARFGWRMDMDRPAQDEHTVGLCRPVL